MTDALSGVRVLHLFSNSKWTGPAEPAINLCRTLRNRGMDITFACTPKTGSGVNKVREMARHYGMEPLDFMRLSKHRHPVWNWLDVRALRAHLRQHAYQIIHCHLDNDTEIALRARAGLDVPVVRSSYEGPGFSADRRHHYFMRHCDMIIEPSRRAQQNDAVLFSAPENKLAVVSTGIDASRFNPDRSLPDMREKIGAPGDAFVLGIVARIQAHRHYEDLFSAFSQFVRAIPAARLVIVGRGTRQEELAFAPVRQLNLEKNIHFTGYLNDDEYVGALAMMDVGLFLTPGTDGTCRAVREMMAMGIPMITSNRGMLDEIVTHEENGLVTDGSPEELLRAMHLLYENKGLRHAYGQAALHTGRSTFSLTHYAAAIEDLYRRLLQPADS